ncbi:MAG: ECF transporter S component [Bacillota bacterium]|jgi:uncharacterized membrane protein
MLVTQSPKSVPTQPGLPGRGFRLNTRQIVVAGLLGSITAVMGVVPYLGLIPLPFSPAGHATIMHIPVILAAVLEGPVVGGLVGFIFGLFSFMQATLPFFKDPIIAFVPRVLIGVFAYYAYVWVRRPQARAVVTAVLGLAVARTVYEAGLMHPVTAGPGLWVALSAVVGLAVAAVAWLVLRGENAPPAMAAIVGTLTNTILVLSLIVIRFKTFTPGMAFFVGLTHGLPELIVAVVLVVLLYRGIKASLKRG